MGLSPVPLKTDPNSDISLGGVAQLINALAPIFLGSGKTTDQQQGVTTGTTNQNQVVTGTTNQNQTATGTSTQTTTSDAGIIAQLLAAFNTAQQNAANPLAATQPLINEIIRQAQVAFGPAIANSNAAGLYKNTTLGLLAGRASAEAANAGAATALNFQTGQQQLAAQIGNALLGATKTQTTNTTGNTGTTGTTQQNTGTTGTTQQVVQQQGTKQTAPAIGGSGGSNLLTGLLGIGGSIFGPSLLKGLLKGVGVDVPDLNPISLISRLFGGGAPTLSVPGSISANDAGAALNAFSLGGIPPQAIGGGGAAANIANIVTSPAVIADPGVTTGAAGTIPAAVGDDTFFPGLANTTTTVPGIATGNPLLGPLPSNASLFGTTAESLSGIGTDLGPGLQTASDVEALLGLGSSGGGAAGTGLGAGLQTPADAEALLGLGGGTGVGLNAGGALDFGTPNVANVFSDIGAGNFGSLALDLSNPIAGIAGGLLAKLIAPDTKAVGGGVGGLAGGVAGGAAGGALLGPALGSFAGPVGTLAGALIGTLLGGRIGPNAPNTYSFAGLRLNPDGTVALGNQISQATGSAGQIRNSVQTQVDALNQFLTTSGLKIANPTTTPAGIFQQLNGPGQFIIGNTGPITLGIDQTRGTPQTPNLVPGVLEGFNQLRFTSDNPALANLVSGRSFTDPNALAAALDRPQVAQPATVASDFINTPGVPTAATNPAGAAPLVPAPTPISSPSSPTLVPGTPAFNQLFVSDPVGAALASRGLLGPIAAPAQDLANVIAPTQLYSGGTG